MPYAPYDALTTEQKLALSRAVPPQIGEMLPDWFARAMAATGGTGTPMATGYTGLKPPIADMPYSGPPITPVVTQPAAAPGGLPTAIAGLVPPGLAAGGAGLLGGGTLATLLAAGYGISQALGVQYPWETGPGEGMIAPWTRDLKKDEAGRWVTRETRPDLFNGAALVPANGGTATVAVQGRVIGPGRGVVKAWDTGYTDAQGNYHPGWPFAMTADADGKHKRIHTVTKDGVPVSWAPYRPIVLGKRMKQGMALRAVRKLQGIKDLAYRIEDLAGKGMKHTVKRSKKK